jgi:molybdopterin synthase sulfur carrier subunit
VANVAALRDHLVANGRSALATAKNLRCAVNQEMASADTVLKAGDEVAFFPPVTGG